MFSRHHPEDAGICAHDFSRSVPAFSGPATDREVFAAVVWRRSRRVDDLPALFSISIGWRVCLCACPRTVFQAADTNSDSPRLARHGYRQLAHRALGSLEDARWSSCGCNYAAAGGQYRIAFFGARGDGATASELVGAFGEAAVPFVRVVKPWVIARACELSGIFRGPFYTKDTSSLLGIPVRLVRICVRILHSLLAERLSGSKGLSGC